MKKRYMTPSAVSVEMKAEQMIAGSMKVSDKSVNTQLSNRKDMWGKEGMWK